MECDMTLPGQQADTLESHLDQLCASSESHTFWQCVHEKTGLFRIAVWKDAHPRLHIDPTSG